MPSSTSQSVLVEPRGILTWSLGPMIEPVCFMNTIGTSGIGELVSRAWSA
jgi:hypothetical protein